MFLKDNLFYSGVLFSILVLIISLSVVVFNFDLGVGYLTFCFFLYCLLTVFFLRSSKDKGDISPISFFCLSFFVFLFARPFLYLFFDMEMVEAGYESDFSMEVRTVNYLVLMYSFLLLFFIFLSRVKFYFKPILDFNKIYGFNYLLLIASLFLFLIFLHNSYQLVGVVSSSNYLELAGSDLLSKYIPLFFLGKWLLVLYILLTRSDRVSFFLCAGLIFISAAGFAFIGLRGYFIAYFFVFLYFLGVYFRLKKIHIIFVFTFLVYLSSLIFEYRLGYAVYGGLWDVLIRTIHQQGATFEVVYGALNYYDAVDKCLNLGVSFGSCVDRSRGVFWDYGGFATSFFAEFMHANIFLLLPIVFLFSISLVMADYFSFNFRKYKDKFSGFYVFMIIPNIVYVARSDLFDLISKTAFLIAIFVFLFFAKKLLRLI